MQYVIMSLHIAYFLMVFFKPVKEKLNNDSDVLFFMTELGKILNSKNSRKVWPENNGY